MDLTLSGAYFKMHKPEATEEFSVCGSVPSILGFAITEVLKFSCMSEPPGECQIYLCSAPTWRFCVTPGHIGVVRQRTTAWKVDAVGVCPLMRCL